MRQLTKHTTLYSEMIVADAIIHGDRERILGFNACETPLVLQLGSSDPIKLAKAVKLSQDYAYSEINLNCGCPSDRVQAGCFGAALMLNPQLVVDCFLALSEMSQVPVTIKHRIGIDYNYDYDYLANFVDKIAKAGCKKFIIHARNAVLKGLSPKENREIPPLKYDYVYRIKQDFPELEIMINGGIKTVAEIDEHLVNIDSVMIGREAYYNPYLFAEFDAKYYGADKPLISRKEVALAMIPYMEQQLAKGLKLHHITRHMIGLYHCCRNAKFWRQQLTTEIIHNNSLGDYVKLVELVENI
jgi:tRNA-dihydrouridine synthase A